MAGGGAAAASRITKCEARDLRQYLAAVYPTASFSTMSRNELSQFMDGLDFVYDFGCSTARCIEPGALLRFLYGPLLPCRQPLRGLLSSASGLRYRCIAAHHSFSLALWQGAAPREYLEVEHRAFGLGLPQTLLPAHQRDARRPRGAIDVMDAGPGGMWYFYRKGSGVWLRTGRMK
eukprot:5086701-Prymnesium_polylepis.1